MFSIVIQAGGKSSRMGKDKALLPFLGRPLIERIISRVEGVGDEILVITNRPEQYRFLELPLFEDVIPGRGALGGLYTALRAASGSAVGLVACDLPFASRDLLLYLFDILLDSGADAVLPSTQGGLEPMHALYRRETCLPIVKSALGREEWKMVAWHDRANVQVLTPAETRQIAPDPRTFWNLNTPEEFQKAEEDARGLD
jgi:molybdopterin-guanine dinucleotide biosynthesis protein A